MRRISALLALISLASFPLITHAIEWEKATPDELMQHSTENPSQVHLLKVGATWCGPCNYMDSVVKGVDPLGKTPLTRAFIAKVDLDVGTGEEVYEAWAEKHSPPTSNGIPYTLAIKNGKIIGKLGGAPNSAKELDAFVDEAEVFDPAAASAASAATPFQKLPCGPLEQEPCSIVGLSGTTPQDEDSTAAFGINNLRTFNDLFKSAEFKKLFIGQNGKRFTEGRIIPGKAVGEFYVSNPLADSAGAGFSDAAEAEVYFQNLDKVSGKHVRVMFTGHGMPQGIMTHKSTPQGYRYKVLDVDAVSNGINAARRAGKTVRTLSVQCFGGQYAESVMPLDGKGATGCGAFASFPDKTSSGCYPNDIAKDRQDYVSLMSQLKKCDGTQNARDLHYEIVAKSKSHDSPMLSSEYFLTYGPVAQYLLSNEQTVRTPAGNLVTRQLDNGVNMVFDPFTHRVVKSVHNGRPLPLPKIEYMGCTEGDPWFLDRGQGQTYPSVGWNPVDLHQIKTRSTSMAGAKIVHCIPMVRYVWPAYAGVTPAVTRIVPLPKDQPALVQDECEHSNPSCARTTEDLVDIALLRPEAALATKLLEKIPEYFQDSSAYVNTIQPVINAAQSSDPARAGAIQALLNRIVEKKGKEKYAHFTGLRYTALKNLGTQDIHPTDLEEHRLSFLVLASLAEAELREKAETDKKAQDLLTQLLEMKDCEKNLY